MFDIEKIYPWDREQLDTLALLAELPQECRDKIIMNAKIAHDSLDSNKKSFKYEGRDFKHDPLILTSEEIEHYPYLLRILTRSAIRCGYMKVVDEK